MAFEKAYFKSADKRIEVEFNPSEYTISATSKTQEEGNGSRWRFSRTKKTSIGEKETSTLQFTLHFDTYMQSGTWGQEESALPEREDVRKYTNEILELSRNGQEGKKQLVRFVWGSLDFLGTIEQINQKFIMFAEDGRPVRAQLDITMVSETNSIYQPAAGGTASGIDWSSDQWQNALKGQMKRTEGKIRVLLDLEKEGT